MQPTEEVKPSKEMSMPDHDGYELAKRPRRFAQFLLEIFAVDPDVERRLPLPLS